MSSETAALICVFLSLFFLFLYLCYRNAMKKVEGFPFYHLIPKLLYDQLTGKIPKDVPLTAHFLYTLTDLCKRNYKEGLFMTYITQPVLFIFSEDAIKFFINEKAAADKPPEYQKYSDLVGDGIVTSNGERYKAHRKMIHPVFNLGMLKEKVPLFNEYALRLVQDMENMTGKPSADPLDALKINLFTSLSESVLGLKQSKENIAENVGLFLVADTLAGMVVQKIIYPWLHFKFLLPFSTFGRKYLKHKKEVVQFIENLLNDMKKHIASNKIVNDSDPLTDSNSVRFSNHLRKSFSYIVLNSHLNDPSFTFQDLYAETTTTLGAGYDTATYTLLWCLFLLGHHPEVQEKAFEEIQSTTDEYVSYDDTCNLPYLEAVLMETLRLFSSIPIIGRKLSEDVQYGKYKVHKGTTIFFLINILHRTPENYPNPEKFDPERFLNGESKRSGTYMPFGDGYRICIGKKYAMIEMKIFLTYLLRNFTFTSLDKLEDIHPCWTIALTPSRPIRMKINSRKI